PQILRKSIFPSHFRRKYIIGEAYITHRQMYITDLQSKSISLRGAYIPMRTPQNGSVFLPEKILEFFEISS
ncbi:MAG: hypothetical protein IKB65_07755, partial [Ruminiclostridium sp.]|nr:hypothetical protein [Ruminiclostridium sp.]